MSSNRKYHYFVEGETEKKLIEELKKEQNLIVSGAVNVFNVVEKRFSNAIITNLQNNTIAILVFDTDKKTTGILVENIRLLKRCRSIREVWCVMQVEDLEDELVRSTDIKQIKDLIGCRSNRDFKRDFLKEKRVMLKLKEHNFTIERMWSTKPSEEYRDFQNMGSKIKLNRAISKIEGT